MKLTRRQQDIYDYLHENAERFAHPPTYDELCQQLGLSSRGSPHKPLQALIEAVLVEPMQELQGIRPGRREQARTGIPPNCHSAPGRPMRG